MFTLAYISRLASIAFFYLPAAVYCAAIPFSGARPNIAIFGDSYADAGNIYALTAGKGAYWNGRFTNGPNWVDYLSAALRQPVFNFAVGGALINNAILPPRTQTGNNSTDSVDFSSSPSSLGVMPCISTQVNAFVSNPVYSSYAPMTTAVIEAGGNDYVWLVGNPKSGPVSVKIQQEFVERATDSIIQSSQLLVNSGVRRLVVWNMGNITGSQMTSAFNQDACASITNNFNKALEAKFERFKQQNMKRLEMAQIFDSFGFSSFCKDSKTLSSLGITEIRKPCLKNTGFSSPGGAATPQCADPEKHFFYDFAHFTSRIHAIFGITIARHTINPRYKTTEAGLLNMINQYRINESTSEKNFYTKIWPKKNSQVSWL
ncbi:hypothetical protein H4219_002433 [Mycoemilia scoparia]|uniref:Uncharacterized protein n=1 Tax=Mycoemilia scoparia TaxID=417184 RepID=A0A9W8DUS5_9FUNG|nr:hypothetical protein H4219_002433 [Mycoemilia scoparia]